jgi:Spy/CpxP family protein refolding chaperone
MKLKLLMVAAVSALGISSLQAQSAGASPSATAEEQQHQWHQHHHGFWKALNLTDAQRQQLHQQLQGDKSANKGLMLNLLNAEKALREAIAKNPNDETTIRSLSATVGNARTELTVQRAKIRSQIVGILTPEQKDKLAQLDQKRENRLQKRIDHLNGTNS